MARNNARSSSVPPESTRVSAPKPGAPNRPTIFTEALAAEICRRISLGETLSQVCRDESMPDRTRVREWRMEHSVFATQYAEARLLMYEVIADECYDIVDEGRNDWIVREIRNSKGEVTGTERVVNHEHINRSRLRFDMRRWHLSKVLPKIYGDSNRTELTGADGAPLIPPVQPTLADFYKTVSRIPIAALCSCSDSEPNPECPKHGPQCTCKDDEPDPECPKHNPAVEA